jgi:uncharacterized membrane protein
MLRPLHITAGAIAIVAGFIALFAFKGATLHRRSGTIFVYAMLIMALSATALSVLKAQRLNAAQAVITFYLVTTALLAVRHRVQEFRWLDAWAMLVALAAGLYEVTLGIEALNSTSGRVDGAPAALLFTFAAVPLVAVLGDVRLILGRRLQGAPRIARHLWRMCFALFIASGSFFLGQAKVIPKPIRILPLLAIPALLPLVMMFYWMARVSFTQWYRRRVIRPFRTTPLSGSAQ